MQLSEDALDALPSHPRGFAGSRQWTTTTREALLHRFQEVDFTEVRTIGDTLDLYMGDEWAWSIARVGESYYLRRVGLAGERDMEWLTMPGAGRAGVAVYVARRWARAIQRWRDRHRRGGS